MTSRVLSLSISFWWIITKEKLSLQTLERCSFYFVRMRNINKLTLVRYYLFLLVYYRKIYRRSFNLKIFTLDSGIYNEGLQGMCVFSKLINEFFDWFSSKRLVYLFLRQIQLNFVSLCLKIVLRNLINIREKQREQETSEDKKRNRKSICKYSPPNALE